MMRRFSRVPVARRPVFDRAGAKVRLLHRLALLLPAAFLSAAHVVSAQTPEPGLDISEITFPSPYPSSGVLSEGSTATYTVALKSDPGGTVTVTPSSSHPESLSVSPASLSFDGTDWADPKTVTVTALADDNDADESVTIRHAVSGYGDLTDGPRVTLKTPEPGLDISEIAFRGPDRSSGVLSEGSKATYTVALKSDPGGTVTVTPSSSHPGSLSVLPASLSFDGTDWADPKTVTVTALADDNNADESVTISHAVSGYGALTDGPKVTLKTPEPGLDISEIAFRGPDLSDPLIYFARNRC